MTQEELKKEMDDQTKTELDTYVEGQTAVIDQLDKGFTDINTQLEQGQTLMKEANDLQTQYTIDEIERQKAEAQKGYEKEQKAAFVDYQKQINPYGATAESMAAAGLDNSGYAESSKVAMYNQYQNRVGVAREALTTAIAEYNSSIAAAKVQNSVAMAQLAYDTLLKKMEYTTSHLLKKTDLLNQLVEGKTSIVQRGNDRWLEVLDKINSADLFDDDVQPQLEEDKGFFASIFDGLKGESAEAPKTEENGNVATIPEGAQQSDRSNATALGNLMNAMFNENGKMPEGDPYGLSLVHDYQSASNVLARLNLPESEKSKLMTRAQFKAWKKGLSEEDKAKDENKINYQQYLRDYTEYAVYYYGNKG